MKRGEIWRRSPLGQNLQRLLAGSLPHPHGTPLDPPDPPNRRWHRIKFQSEMHPALDPGLSGLGQPEYLHNPNFILDSLGNWARLNQAGPSIIPTNRSPLTEESQL